MNEGIIRKELNAIKRKQFPWMLEVTKCAPEAAIGKNLNRAFKNFFDRRARFPVYHKKGRRDSFSVYNKDFSVNGLTAKIPKLGAVRLAEPLRFSGKIVGATVSRTADKWYIAIDVAIPDPEPKPAGWSRAVGVDVGVKALATLSDGTVIAGPNASRRYEQKMRRLNKELSRRKGSKNGEAQSNNFQKTKRKLARLHARIANVRADATHKITRALVKNYDLIGIEKLNTAGMLSNHKIARYIADNNFYELRRQLEYKAGAAGTRVIVADKWYASSKTCSICGSKRETLPLNIRKWTCESCGAVHDRDVNAAINLKNYAVKNAVGCTVTACGGLGEVMPPKKQELSADTVRCIG
ncbi:transposase [Fibrobacteres bacterium R8-0-B4]